MNAVSGRFGDETLRRKSPPGLLRRAPAHVAPVVAAILACAGPVRAQTAEGTPKPAHVDESPPKGMPASPRTLASWAALWLALPKRSPDLRIALAEIERAEAATRIAWGATLPSVTGVVNVNYSSSRSTDLIHPTGAVVTAQLSVTQTLVNLRAFHQIATQRALEEIATLSVLDVRRRIGLALARAAASIMAADRIAQGNRTSLELSLQRLDLTRRRLAAGLGDARDLVRAEQDVATSRGVIPPSDESLIEAREGLATLLGLAEAVDVGGDLGALEAELAAFCAAPTSDAERIDVRIASEQIVVAERNVDDIALKFLPTVVAQATAAESGALFAAPFNGGWIASATLTVPFFDGGVRYGERRDRLALVEEARARALQVQISAIVERAVARRAIEVAAAARDASREARDLAAEADRLARVAYAAGIGTNFDLVDAGRILRQAETDLVVREVAVTQARVSLPFVEGNCQGTRADPAPSPASEGNP